MLPLQTRQFPQSREHFVSALDTCQLSRECSPVQTANTDVNVGCSTTVPSQGEC